MTINEYIDYSFDAAKQYKKDVETGAIITCKWIKAAVERSRRDEKRKDLEIRREAVARVYEFFSFLNININNKYSQFIPSPYQAWILAELFGWYYKKTGRRRYRYGLLYTARKSGKSVFAVGIMLYMLMYDRENNSETYIVANSREQSGHALDYAKEIVSHSPIIRKRLNVQQYKIIFDSEKSGKSYFQTKASKAESLDSLNVHGAICDEFHEYPDMKLWNVLKSGTLSRDNPMLLITSTAGTDRAKPFYNLVEIGKKVVTGELDNDSMFYALYTLDDDNDPNDPECWIKSNPNIGITVELESLIAEFEHSKLTEEELVNFYTKNLNVYTDSVTQWIPEDVLTQSSTRFNLMEFRGWPAYIGVDLSKTRDLAAAVVLFERDFNFYAFPLFFCAKDTKRIRAGGIDLREWIDAKYILECPKRLIDLDFIFDKLAQISRIFDVQLMLYDKYNASTLIGRLQSETEIYCEPFQQTAMNFNFPLKFMEARMFAGEVSVSDNPVMIWNIRNIVLYEDPNSNIKIAKNKALDSVDGAVALAQAFAAYIKLNLDPETAVLGQYLK